SRRAGPPRGRAPPRRERAAGVERLIAAHELHVLQLDSAVTVTHGRLVPGRPPFDALRTDCQLRKVNLLMIRMENDIPLGLELARFLLELRIEFQLLVCVRRRRAEIV